MKKSFEYLIQNKPQEALMYLLKKDWEGKCDGIQNGTGFFWKKTVTLPNGKKSEELNTSAAISRVLFALKGIEILPATIDMMFANNNTNLYNYVNLVQLAKIIEPIELSYFQDKPVLLEIYSGNTQGAFIEMNKRIAAVCEIEKVKPNAKQVSFLMKNSDCKVDESCIRKYLSGKTENGKKTYFSTLKKFSAIITFFGC